MLAVELSTRKGKNGTRNDVVGVVESNDETNGTVHVLGTRDTSAKSRDFAHKLLREFPDDMRDNLPDPIVRGERENENESAAIASIGAALGLTPAKVNGDAEADEE